MRRILLIIALVPMAGFAQSISHSTYSSNGYHYIDGGFQADYTIGEAIMYSFNNAGNILSQGFHQPTLTNLGGLDEDFINIQVGPNPSTGYCALTLEHETYIKSIELLNSLGQIIQTIFIHQTVITYMMDLQNLATGMYYIHINLSKASFIYKIIKN